MVISRFLAALAAVLVAAAPVGSARAQPAPDEAARRLEADIPTAPVKLDERTLFQVRGTSSFPAEDRAERIAVNLRAVARDPAVPADGLVVEPTALGLAIRGGATVIVTLVPADAALEAVQLPTLAESHRQRLQAAIAQYRQEREPGWLARGAAYSLGATAVFAVLVFLAGWLFRRLIAVMETRVRDHVETLPAGRFQIIQGHQLWEFVVSTVRGLRLLVVLVLVYLWLQFVLSKFPWTRWISEQLLNLLVTPLARIGSGFLDYIPNLLFLVVLILVTRYGLRLLRLYFAALERGTQSLSGFEPEWAMPAYKIIRAVVLGLALVMAYPYLPGAGSEALQGLSVFAGLMLSLGASGAVGNVIAGYFNTFGRVFRVGDMIRVGEVIGTVTQVRLLTTRLRTAKNEEVTLPNATIINTHLVNYSALARSDGLVLHTEVGIGYEVAWRQVHAMLEEAARRTPGLLAGRPPFILQRQLGDFAVVYQLNVYVDTPVGMLQTYSNLHQNILDVFNEHGVQIMTPAYEGDPEQAKVVPKDQWFAPPARPAGDAAPPPGVSSG